MSRHLVAIGSKVASGCHAALVLDGAGYHIAAALTIPKTSPLRVCHLIPAFLSADSVL